VLFAGKVKGPAQAELGRANLEGRLDAIGRATRGVAFDGSNMWVANGGGSYVVSKIPAF
jgi:hypothetical protein